MGISRRLFYSHLATALLVSMVVGGYLLYAARQEILTSQSSEQMANARLLAAAVPEEAAGLIPVRSIINDPNYAVVARRLEALQKADPTLRRLTLLTADGPPKVLLDVGGTEVLPGDTWAPVATPSSDPKQLNVIALPTVGGLSLRIESTSQNVDERLAEIRKTALLSFILMAGLSLLVGRYLGGMARAVLQQLASASRRIADGEFDVRLRVNTQDEFGELAQAFNDMAERLKRTLGEREGALLQTRKIQKQLEANVAERNAENYRISEMLRIEAEQRSRLEAVLAEAAATDQLTQLLNRLGMLSVIESLMKQIRPQGRCCAFMLLDVDYFKRINDTFGHDVGDQVLSSVSRAIKAELTADEVAARWGGEEFLLMWPDCNEVQAEHRANRLRELIASQRWLKDGRPVTVSAGVVVVRGDDEFDRALTAADAALYRAKEAGRNRVLMADTTKVVN